MPDYPVFDPGVVDAIVGATPSWLAHLVVALTYLGSIYVVVPALVVGYWLAPARRAAWPPVALGYYGLVAVAKAIASTSRPDAGPPVGVDAAPAALEPVYAGAVVLDSGAFPSGHTLAATLLAGLFVLDGRVGRRRQRLFVATPFVALVAATRLVLGVHYPVDLLGGLALGIGVLAVVRLLRDSASGPAVLFALAAGLGLAAAWTLPPSALAWSAEAVVLGGSAGGLVAWWWLQRATATPSGAGPAPRLVLAPGLVTLGLAAAHLVVPHPLLTVALAAVATGGAVLAPWVRRG